ncbi:MAG TPA: hypothetical protein VMT15_15370 [Bryobacteraceae bacterium]|nr:hypothetical protein [Bryobacteraceae bacterium]
MADFRKWLFALAAVALLAGLSVPASAQGSAVACNVQSATDNLLRIEGMTEQVGDVVLACTGGIPTAQGLPIPSINIQIFMNLNVTSKILGNAAANAAGAFDEALLIIDEPNTAQNPNVPLFACDYGAHPAGCVINGLGGANTGTGTGTDPYAGTVAAPAINVFQGRQALNSLQNASVVFQGVPFDPPGSGTRYLRITNVRVNANALGVSAPSVQIPVTMGIGSSGSATLPLSFLSLTVGTAQQGLTAAVTTKNLGFAQCNSVNPKFSVSGGSTQSGSVLGVTFSEGFSNSWKVKNLAYTLANGTVVSGAFVYGGTTVIPTGDNNQNVPGVNYFTETGFESNSTAANPVPNPPPGFQYSGTVNANGNLTSSNGVGGQPGVAGAGIASQGTRLALALQGVPNGLTLYVPEVVNIYRVVGGANTGVMVLVATDGVAGANTGTATTAATTNPFFAVSTTNGAALLVYEVLFSDPYSIETATVPIVVSYTSNLSANAPAGLPQPNQVGTAAGGFAPFYTPPTGTTASSSMPIPRFVFTGAYAPLLEVVKCSCNLLFPYVTQAPGYDTGIAIANTTADIFGTAGQFGTITLNYFNGSTSAPIPQCTNTTSPGTCPGTTVVGPGQVLTYTLYNGSAQWGLNNSGTGFTGYMIASAQFQYCHAFAFIGGLGGGPTSGNGLSEGYLALVLDTGSFLQRSPLPSEQLVH